MAEIKVTHPDVESAEHKVLGFMAEAQSLVQLLEGSQDESPFVILSANVINRLTDAMDLYHTELLRHGFPSLDERDPSRLEV